MITAEEAKELSEETLNVEIVNETLNSLELFIKKACSEGKRYCDFYTEDLKIIGAIDLIMRKLNSFGYNIKVSRDTYRNVAYAKLYISW